MDKRTAGYDPVADAEAMARPVREWARLGFLRGFAGMGADTVPVGRTMMPSAAFIEAAEQVGHAPAPDGEEAESREAYVETVHRRLTEIQAEAVSEHYRRAAMGHVADALLGLSIVGVMATLFWAHGPLHPATLAVVLLLGVKLAFVHFSARRALKLAEGAFAAKASDVVLPWRRAA